LTTHHASRRLPTFDLSDLRGRLDVEQPGEEIYALCAELFPICRSITGNGVRDTLAVVGSHVSLQIHEVPTGTPVLDWIVPKEWNIRDAYLMNCQGQRVVDFNKSNLHVVGYSIPVHGKATLSELKGRLHTLPDRPDFIPYRNSYYTEDWGFCLSDNQLRALPEGEYEYCIDSSLQDGSLTYAELTLPGSDTEEVLVSCHICHPSLANDNVSGIAVATYLARYLASVPHRCTYRILFLPVTIGAITWLARNEHNLERIRHGLVLSLLGDRGHTTYKRSQRENAVVDRAVMHVLERSGAPYEIQDFVPYGYDERQFCSPGFDLPVGCLMRTPHGQYPEYHTSGDNMDFITPESLEDSLAKCLAILEIVEKNACFRNLNPKGEPQLGRRGLYRAMADRTDGGFDELALLWVLNQSDGNRSLLDIADRSGLSFSSLRQAALTLQEHGLLELLERVDS
jgi:aminopeptidase-like protein